MNSNIYNKHYEKYEHTNKKYFPILKQSLRNVGQNIVNVDTISISKPKQFDTTYSPKRSSQNDSNAMRYRQQQTTSDIFFRKKTMYVKKY